MCKPSQDITICICFFLFFIMSLYLILLFHRQSWANIDTVHDVNNMQKVLLCFSMAGLMTLCVFLLKMSWMSLLFDAIHLQWFNMCVVFCWSKCYVLCWNKDVSISLVSLHVIYQMFHSSSAKWNIIFSVSEPFR